jgi:uncharacterized membrane protein YheB (UPF0754 family)
MNLIAAFTLPIVAGLIGWLTNYLAVKMLFHPRKAKKILGITFQGVFPKRQAEVAEKIGMLVANELLASKDILAKFNSHDNIEQIKDRLKNKLDDYFSVKFVLKYPVASKFLPVKAKEKLKEEILKEIDELAPDLIQSQIHFLESKLDIKTMISTKVNQLSSEKLEKVIWNILSTEFKFIEWVGALLGFSIGLVQVLLAYVFL